MAAKADDPRRRTMSRCDRGLRLPNWTRVPGGRIAAYGESLRSGAARGCKIGGGARAGSTANLDDRRGTEDVLLATHWFADHGQIRQRTQHPLRHGSGSHPARRAI